MPRRSSHLVATERQVTSILGRGDRAVTFRTFLAEVSQNCERKAAPPAITLLATALALDELREECAGSYAMVAAIDEAIGALRRSGIGPDLLRRTKDARPAPSKAVKMVP